MSEHSGTWHPLARLPDEWHAWLQQRGEASYRADQVFQWLHRRGEFRAEAMSNLGQELRQRLGSEGLAAPGEVVDSKRSADGTRKLLISMASGGQVECVLIPMTPKTAEDAEHWSEPEDTTQPDAAAKRVTLCISTQYGCAMGDRKSVV